MANGKPSSIRDLTRKLVGEWYRDGRGVTQSDTEAFYWLSKAANGEIPDAQFALGELYETGRGVAPNPTEAYVWYAIAAKAYGRFGDAKEALVRAGLDRVAGTMSPEERGKAQKRADNWRPAETITARGGASGITTSIFDAH